MPRKKGPEAEADAAKARESRWRYLLRNPEFRAELNELRRHSHEASFNYKRQPKFMAKWDLYGFHSKVLNPKKGLPDLAPESVEAYEPFFQIATRAPVTAYDAYEAFQEDVAYQEALALSDISPEDLTVYVDQLGPPGPGVCLEIIADLRYPRDLLMSLIEQKLREAKKRPRPQQRRRLDKLDFYLKAYDLSEKGETFKAIAKSLKRPVSTVKSAYVAAYKQIYGVKIKHSKKTLPRDTFDWENLDPEEHFKTCRACQKAKTADEMCPPLRLHVTQEHRGQRESTGYDTRR